MINSSTRFNFDNKWSDDVSLPRIINATLNNDFYSFNVIGEKSIIEDQIQGRDEPYLYNVDFKPLEFTINIAFENYETIDEVTKVIKWLYGPNTYKRLKFEGMDTNFFAIFVGSPEYYYVGRRHENTREYIGYIVCKVRTNAPYGYTDILETSENTGDLQTYPSFTIESNETAGRGIFTLLNETNSTSFKYFFANNETLTFNGYTKTLSTDVSGKNPYLAWDKNYVILESGQNDDVFTTVYGELAAPPADPADGETYQDTSDGNKIKAWNATLTTPAWEVVQAPVVAYQYRAPKYL